MVPNDTLDEPTSGADGGSGTLAAVDMGDIGRSEKERNREISKTLFPDDEVDDDAPAPVVDEPVRTEPEPPPAPVDVPPGLKADKNGRLHRPDGTVASKEEVAAARAAAKGAVEAPPDATAPAAVTDPVEPAVDAGPTPEPVKWLAYGQELEIPGALHKEGHGYFIPDEQGPTLRQAYARAQRYPVLVEQNERLRADMQSSYSQKEAEADALIGILGGHVATPQALADFAERVAQNPVMAHRELQLAIREQQMELGKNIREPDQALLKNEPDPGEIAEALTDSIESMFRRPELAGKFTPAERRALTNRTFQHAGSFLVRAPADDTSQGIRKGELLVNEAALWKELQYEAGRRGAGTSPTTSSTTAPKPAGAQPAPAVTQAAPPSAVSRSRASASPSASQPGTQAPKGTIPTKSLAAAARALFDDDE